MSYQRSDKRKVDEMRPLCIHRNYIHNTPGTILVEVGNTRVICTASVERRVPAFMRDEAKKRGWLTAEYDMLPRSASKRIIRDRSQIFMKGRSQEIQRLIGRSLRAVTDLTAFPEHTIYVDCDVIQADGGTRTAAINGSFIALYDLFTAMKARKKIEKFPLTSFIGAISVGVVNNTVLLDLAADEDMAADVDMNIVKDENGGYIELQGTREQHSFTDEQLQLMLTHGDNAVKKIINYQKSLLFSF